MQIKITIGPSKKLIGESAFIQFDYDKQLVSFMTIFEERYYHPKEKIWEIQSNELIALIKQFRRNHSFHITYKKEAGKQKSELRAIPADYSWKLKPFEHQIQAVRFALTHPRYLLADEQGLGKTKSCIDAETIRVLQGGGGKCLILCGVNGSKWNWKKEVQNNSCFTARVLGEQKKKNGVEYVGSTEDKVVDLLNAQEHFLITNMESLRNERFLSQLHFLIKNNKIGTIIFDEIHRCGNPQSQQGKGLLSLTAPNMVAISGTPILNHPLDAFAVLKWLGKETHSMTAFKKHYCILGGFGGNEILGYKNMGELRNRIKEIELRRLKVDCLDLPPKIHTDEFVEMGQKQKQIYQEVLMELRANIDKIKMSPNPLTMMLRLRQATGYTGILSSAIQESIKYERAEQIIEEVVENGGKCLVFSNWTEVLNPFYKRLERYNPALMTGEIKKDVESQKTKFQKDDSCKVCVGTIGFMGTSHTLTAANTVIFLDEPWNKGTKEQAEDRAYRIGTRGTVNIITLRCKGTIDEKIAQILDTKGMYADFLVDGIKATGNRAELVDFLLG